MTDKSSLTDDQRKALIAYHQKKIHEFTNENTFWPNTLTLVERVMAEAHEIASLVPDKEAADASE